MYASGGLSTCCTSGIPYDRVNKQNPIHIQCYTLDSILEKECVTNIDVISIDVEGFEDKVLGGFSIDFYNPLIIIIELHAGPRPDNNKLSEFRNPELIKNCESYLTNYTCVYTDHINNIYVRK